MNTTTTQPALIEPPDEENALNFFVGGEDTARPMLKKVEAHVIEFRKTAVNLDANNEKDRALIKNFVGSLVRTRTTIDAVGLVVARRVKAIPGQVDATRRLIREELEAWEDELRAPVTAWEEAEEARVKAIKDRLAELQNLINDVRDLHSDVLRGMRAALDQDVFSERMFGEYLSAAIELRASAITRLDARIASATQREAEKAELEAFRKQQEKERQAERDEKIRQEGIAAAVAEAQRKAEQAVKQQLDEAAAKVRAAEAQLAAPAAVVTAQPQVPAPSVFRVDELTEAQRERVAAINRTARNALITAGIPASMAQKVIELIGRNKIPAVVIDYGLKPETAVAAE